MTRGRSLVTGANGFVGQALCRALLQEGHAVRAMVRSAVPLPEGMERTQTGTLDGRSDCMDMLTGVDTVFHLAARVHQMHDGADSIALYRRANVEVTLHLARQAVQAGVARMVFVSTAKAQAELSAPGQPLRETDTPNPQDPYASSKLEAETALLALAAQTGLQVVVVRPPLVYGPGTKANFAALEHAVRRGFPLPLASIRHNKRSLLALANLVDFLQLCGKHPAASGEVFLVSDDCDLSTAELVWQLAQAIGTAPRLLWCPESLLRMGGTLLGRGAMVGRLCDSLQLDITKAKTRLGWSPKVSVEEAMRQAVTKVGVA